MWSVDDKGRMVEEIHRPDGRTEILVHMGHSIETSSIGEKIGNMVRLLIPFALIAVGVLIGKFM